MLPSIKRTLAEIGSNPLEVVRIVIAEMLQTEVRLGDMNSEKSEAATGETGMGKTQTGSTLTRTSARKRAQGACIVKGWEDKHDRGHILDTLT